MLSTFRNNPKLVVGIFGLVGIAFVATGVISGEMPGMGGSSGPTAGSIAKVGDTSVSSNELEQRIRSQFQQAQQQQPSLTMAGFFAGGAFTSLVEQTIGASALEQYARQIGLVASDKQVGGSIAAIPSFRGPDGKFSQQAYDAAIAQQRLSDKDVRADFAGDILRQMVYLPVTGAMTLPDGLVKPYAALLMETRAGEIGFVPVTATAGGTAPTPADLQNFYQSHIAAYTTPERRSLRYAVIGRDQVAAKAVPTDAEIKQVYDANPDKYAARETRDLSQIVLPDEAKAKAFKAAVAGGKSFADAAQAAGFGAADIAVGVKTQAQYAAQASAPLAAAAFALPQGGVSDPVKSEFGWTLVKVNVVNHVAATPFEAARVQIAADLVKSKQDKALADLIAKVQDGVDNGQGFADVTKANGLAITETPAITAGGIAPDQPGFKPSADVQPLLAAGFKGTPDDAPSVETITANERYALLAIGHVIAAAPIPFAQVKDRVSADFIASRASDRAKAIATAIQAKVKGGTSMADAFKAAPVKLPDIKPAEGRRMDLARLQGNVPPPLAALFRATVGGTELVAAPGGQGWYVVHVGKVTPADDKALAPAVQASRSDLQSAANNEYLEQLAGAAKIAVGTRRDDAAIAALQARMLGATPAAGQ
ncbi:peptidylprolyl isomerase [Sphingomonas abietis]|uniref:Parvulin-like PPIase n=1 Tax=Sphingomonas abietis TaxID=3012344 RepID=A0ABY7NTA1_9SPHN|nr:peptidyl-prolyl cis-trans isomerase [Sphingomonas abietis]WBO23671.1 peptidyl-prolyl cis-trans isomerase [Sphingomonas abietis]